jgi:hypothetical protein
MRFSAKYVIKEVTIYLFINAFIPAGFRNLTPLISESVSTTSIAVVTACIILIFNALRLHRNRWTGVVYAMTIAINLAAFFLFGMLTYMSFLFVLLK